MIKNYLTTAIRYFHRNRFFSFLNILGLAVGFSCSLLLAMFVWQEATYDNFHEKKDRTVRLITDFKMGDYSAQTAVSGAKAGPAFVNDFPEVANAVRFNKYPAVVSQENNQFEESEFLWADSSFFDVFSFKLLKGNPTTALDAPRKMVITPETSARYFGDGDPIGQTLLVNNNVEYEITGIIEAAPLNSQIKYDLIASFSTLGASKNPQWFPANYYTYLLLNPGADIAELESKLSDYMVAREGETGMTGENYLTYHLEKLEDVHLTSDHPGMVPNVDKRYVIIFFIVTLLILSIACINYMNLATARAADRGTEVGVRKVMGAHRSQLFWQYITESGLSVVLAMILSIVLASVLLPYYNNALSKEYSLEIFLSPIPLAVIGIILLVVAFGAGLYPSLILTHFNPVKTLKGSFKTSRAGLGLRRVLIVFQFVVSAGLIICSLVIYRQVQFIQTSDVGYQKEFVITQSIDNEVVNAYSALESLKESLPQIEAMTMVYETPTSIDWRDGLVNNEGEQMLITANPVEKDYVKTFGIKLLAGNDFSRQDQLQAYSDSANVLNQQGRNILINEKAAKEMGWTAEEAIGQKIQFKGNSTIIGVTDNFYFGPVHEEVGPLFLFIDVMYNQVVFRMSGNNLANSLSLVEREWVKLAPHIPFEPQFLDEEFNAMYENEQKLGMLFAFFTVLAVILGSLGLLGLSALMISHRTREIGIRKVLGASVNQIVSVLSVDFMKLVLIAFLISIPVAWYFMDQWLQTFAHRISMPWYIFIFSGLILLVLALITLSTQTVRAAVRNPTDVIRSE